MFQPSFAAEEVPCRSLRTMSKDISGNDAWGPYLRGGHGMTAMMPGVHIYEAGMTEGGRLVARSEREQRKLEREKPAGASSD